MTIYWTKINYFIFQKRQKIKIVQTLLKWSFWTSINLDIIKQNIILAEVCINTVCVCVCVCVCVWVGGGVKASLATSDIYKIFKQNKQLELFIFTQNLLLH